MKVLVVVEDDEDMRALVKMTLSEDASLHITGEARSADEAVEEARRVQPNLVILDHFIEGTIMGLDAAPLIKDAAPNCKVILFSSHDLAVEASRSAAVDAFVSKGQLASLLPTARELLEL